MAAMSEAKRPKEVLHDQTPSQIVDHPFEPRGEWYTLCKHCGLAESAHKYTTHQPIRYYSDDTPDED